MDPGLAASVEEILDGIRDRLRELREHRAVGQGRLGEIDKKLGRKAGYCVTLLREDEPADGRPELRLREVVGLLIELGIDPKEAMPGFFGFDLELYLLKLQRQNSGQIRHVRMRQKQAGPVDGDLDDLAAITEEMERLRLSDPPAGKRSGFGVLAALDAMEASEARARVECECWGALAGLHRMTATFSSGAYCLLRGLEVAKQWGLVGCEAKLLRRCCYLIGDQGDYGEAIECGERARQIYFESLDVGNIGRTLVDSAIMFRRLGDAEAAIKSHRLALRVLPGDAWLDRTCAYQSLGLAYVEGNEIESAKTCLVEMRSALLGYSSARVEAAALCVEGEIALRQNDLVLAKECFRAVTETLLGEASSPELVLMSVRFAQTLLALGDVEELQQLVARMASLPTKFRHNKLVAASINEFLLAGMTSKLTMQVANNVYVKLGGRIPFVGTPPYGDGGPSLSSKTK